ncbi:PIG-L deacetylase family protein [Mycolicibacterium goodii]|uniref:PIG-L family deacetylase n=1 Tax=Mycolicibacterium goodii TaxID=134601 RepID=A0ABS6HQZ5_MYCGD|nr:PIG-L family deacetylase [Mycolicibacterium goodii]MBU8823763.1 PIG-L family deacetylase [Mycolicibacterium goodii]MBU8833101.1 PIG-L family deacetylase [Mycolicibacterium goodii]MBU8835935.1 PIG-L family deacetylase [Mycolicibacterium goodii]
MIDLFTGELREIAVVGAHCDDIAIGMGGTLLTLASSVPGLRVSALVLSGGGTERETEEIGAIDAFCPGSDVHLTVLDVEDGKSTAHWQRIKVCISEFRLSCDPQLVFGPHRGDAHQDHRLLAELLPTEFRDHLVLGYEILKWEADTPRPSIFHPLKASVAEEKARLLHKHYPSQVAHDWFDEQAFLGLARMRGVQCRHIYAESFVMEKATVRFGGHGTQAQY